MKKWIGIIFILMLAISIPSSASAELTFKYGYDVLGSVDNSNSDSSVDANNSFTFSMEYVHEIATNLKIGAGVTYQLPRGTEESNDNDEFSFIPIYSVIKYDIPTRSITPYVTAHVGYNFLNGRNTNTIDYSGGIYYGAGGGFKFWKERLQLEALYSVNKGSMRISVGTFSSDVDMDYSKVTLTLGINVDLF